MYKLIVLWCIYFFDTRCLFVLFSNQEMFSYILLLLQTMVLLKIHKEYQNYKLTWMTYLLIPILAIVLYLDFEYPNSYFRNVCDCLSIGLLLSVLFEKYGNWVKKNK